MSDYEYEKTYLATVVNEQVNDNLTPLIHWENTDNALTDTTDTYATSQFTVKYDKNSKTAFINKPWTLTGHQFNLNLPSNAYVTELRFITSMKADSGLKSVRPVARFNIYGGASSKKFDDTKVKGTGWNDGIYYAYPTAYLNKQFTELTYTMSEADIKKGDFKISALNSSVMGVDFIFNPPLNDATKTDSWTVYCAWIKIRVKYQLPKYNITYKASTKTVDANKNYTVTATFTNVSKANDGSEVLDVELPFGAELVSASATGSSFNSSTLKWTVDTSKTASLKLTLKPMVSGENVLTIKNSKVGTYPHSFYANRSSDAKGLTQIDLTTSPNPHKNHRMCIYADVFGQSDTGEIMYVANPSQTIGDAVWELETGSTGVSVNGKTSTYINLNVPNGEDFDAKLRYCFYPKTTGDNDTTIYSLIGSDVGGTSTIHYTVQNPYNYVISSASSSAENRATLISEDIKITEHRVASDVDVHSFYLESDVNEGDSLMSQSECSLKMYMQEDLDYIGCVPLEHTHFDPKSTFKDTLLDNRYKNKRYMGKKLATDEDITLNVRLHPQQVTTIQGLIEMDKPIPINANHRCFEGDALNHRGWAEIYGIKAEETNPHWYKTEIDVKYLTHNLNTRFSIEKGVKVATYDYPSLMVESVATGTSLEDDYWDVDTDGTFVYSDDSDIDDNVRNLFTISNNQSINIKSHNVLPNQSMISFEWLSSLIEEDEENNIQRIIRLVDSNNNSTVFEYEYTDFEYDDEYITCSIISRRWDGIGWDTSTVSDITLWRDDSILEDDEVEDEDNEVLYGSTIHFNITNNYLNTIETGFNGRETSQAFQLMGSGKYHYEIDIKNNNEDAETDAVDFYVDLTVMDTVLTSDYADKYSKLYVSPFPVANKTLVFTREAEEGTVYYFEDDGEEFTYLINPYYQYQNGTDLKTDTGISIFDLNYGYELVYIQNGLVRLGFNRLNGKLYLAKYDPVSKDYITTHRLHLEKYDDINLNSISDDKIEIQASDSVFTIWRGHPYIMINHNNEDIWIDSNFNTVWAEKVGGDGATELPSYWDLMNSSNLLPSSVGGIKGIKSSDVVLEEVEVSDKESSSVSIVDIYDGSTHYDDFSDVEWELNKDYIFTLDGDVSSIGEELPVRLGVYNGDFGKYTISSDYVLQPATVQMYALPNVIQSGDSSEIQASVLDYNDEGIQNQTVFFYEEYTPILKVKSDKDIFQTGDTASLKSMVIDSEDGSVVAEPNVTVLYYIDDGDD